VWGRESIGRVLNCTSCGRPLVLKSVNPWISSVAGAAAVGLGGFLAAFRQHPAAWLVCFAVGLALAAIGLRQWARIIELDQVGTGGKAGAGKPAGADDANSVVMTCGQCSAKIRVEKGKGHTFARCPNCGAKRRVRT
jgi:DNA-directed RNA polymerase subunit RPC12/RpoP